MTHSVTIVYGILIADHSAIWDKHMTIATVIPKVWALLRSTLLFLPKTGIYVNLPFYRYSGRGERFNSEVLSTS
jgi:hypothetical protein